MVDGGCQILISIDKSYDRPNIYDDIVISRIKICNKVRFITNSHMKYK